MEVAGGGEGAVGVAGRLWSDIDGDEPLGSGAGVEGRLSERQRVAHTVDQEVPAGVADRAPVGDERAELVVGSAQENGGPRLYLAQ